jgi:eukaryotic-like serine/threonine-protein kinase
VSNTPPIQHTPIVPGSVLAGKYRVERIIGQGGMGLVVEARHIALDERVALKFLLPEYAQHPEAATRFIREARAAAKIKSEHVARVSDVGNLDSGAPYMMMEFLEGADLSQTLEKLGVLPVEDAIDYIIQGCEAIAEAHQHGIVHRDLKPANLFLSKRPDGTPIVKVLDFGISKVIGGAVDNLTKTTAAMGSALYMSPEQMQQTRAVDHRTDIYALGIALYELLAGKQPYYADTLPQLCAEILTGTPTPIRSIRPEIPDELALVMEKAYARDKGQRYQSIADLVIALAAFAPPRSQQTIDRVARMAGLPIPIAGAASGVSLRASSPSNPLGLSPPGQGGTQMLQQSYPPPVPQYPPPAPQQGSPATVALPVMDPTAGGPPPQGAMGPAIPNANQIVPGHYQAPASSRASAHFKQGPIPGQTDGSMAANGRLSQPSSGGSKAGVVIAILGVLAVGGAAAAFFLRPHHDVAQPVTGGPGTEKTVDTAAVKPPDTGMLPTTAITPPPADIKSAPPAVSVAEPPVKGVQAPVGNGTKIPVKGATAPPAVVTHAPVTPPSPAVVPPPAVVKPVDDPLAPKGRQGSF